MSASVSDVGLAFSSLLFGMSVVDDCWNVEKRKWDTLSRLEMRWTWNEHEICLRELKWYDHQVRYTFETIPQKRLRQSQEKYNGAIEEVTSQPRNQDTDMYSCFLKILFFDSAVSSAVSCDYIQKVVMVQRFGSCCSCFDSILESLTSRSKRWRTRLSQSSKRLWNKRCFYLHSHEPAHKRAHELAVALQMDQMFQTFLYWSSRVQSSLQ